MRCCFILQFSRLASLGEFGFSLEEIMIRTSSAAVAAAISSALFISTADAATAAQIKVLSGSAIETAMAVLIPQFEKSSGHKVISDFNGAIGAMADRIQKGDAADVAIVSGLQIEMLEKQGKVISGSRTDIAKVGVGLFVRKGAAKPDISSVDAFKRTMLAAKSIGWNDPAAGAPVSIYMIGVLERLGIADVMKPKTVAFKQRSERFEAVARGDVEIGFNQISEIIAAPGVDLVGSLPAPIQNYTLFAGGIVATSKEQNAAKALIRFISSPVVQEIWKSKGFDAP
jgi:molybdate transport system substrate-binding protein